MSDTRDTRKGPLDGRAAKRGFFIDAVSRLKYLVTRFGGSFEPGWSGGRSLAEVLAVNELDDLKSPPPSVMKSVDLIGNLARFELAPGGAYIPRVFSSKQVTISIDPMLTGIQAVGALKALADYYRACGGLGFELDLGESKSGTFGSFPLA